MNWPNVLVFCCSYPRVPPDRGGRDGNVSSTDQGKYPRRHVRSHRKDALLTSVICEPKVLLAFATLFKENVVGWR